MASRFVVDTPDGPRKQCSRCLRVLRPDQFYVCRHGALGRQSWCVDCVTEQRGARKDTATRRARAWQRSHRDRDWYSHLTLRHRQLGYPVFTLEEWYALLEHYGHRCLCCGAANVHLSPDHVVSLHRGGSFTIDNIQPLCHPCNVRKRTRPVDYRNGLPAFVPVPMQPQLEF